MTPGKPGSLSSRQHLANRARWVLIATVALTVLLYLIPQLRLLAWPLLLLSTLAHELGHGIAALAVGGKFTALHLWSDGSGAATYSALVGRLGHALIAAGGLIGPAVAAAIGFGVGRNPRWARLWLTVLGLGLVVAEVFVVRTLFGWLFVALVAAVCLACGLLAKADWVPQAVLVFLSVQLALSVFSRADYLFAPEADTQIGTMASDVAQIADALLLPYWFWGAFCGLLSCLILLLGLVTFLRTSR